MIVMVYIDVNTWIVGSRKIIPLLSYFEHLISNTIELTGNQETVITVNHELFATIKLANFANRLKFAKINSSKYVHLQ